MIANLSDDGSGDDDGVCVVRPGTRDDSQVVPSVIYMAEVVTSG